MIRRPPRSTLFPTRRSSDLGDDDGAGKRDRLHDRQLNIAGAGRQIEYQKIELAPINLPQKLDRKSTRLNSSHQIISYAVFCLKKKKKKTIQTYNTSEHKTAT